MRTWIPLVVVTLALVASSAMAVTVSVPDEIPGLLGQVVTAPVEIDNAEGLLAFNLTVNYDTALLDLSDADVKTGLLTSGWLLVPVVNDAVGQADIACSGTVALGGGSGGSLLKLDFHAGSTPGLSPVSITGMLNEGEPAATFDSGSIMLVPEPAAFALLVGGALVFAFGRRRGRR
jgi:hypothetical protein